MAESLSVPVSDQTCCLVPAAEPPLAEPHERWCGRTGVSHPLLPDFECPGEKTVYVAGDTVYYDGVRAVIEHFQPDVIVVNSCDARWQHGRLIMNAEDVMMTCACAPESLVIASHMEAVSHAHLSRKQLRGALEENSCAGQVLIPEDEELIEI